MPLPKLAHSHLTLEALSPMMRTPMNDRTMHDYEKFSLSKFKEWIHDLLDGDVSVPEIYEALIEVIEEDIAYYSSKMTRAYDLLSMVQGKKKPVDDCMPPWGHSDMEALKYTDEELEAMCDEAEKQEQNISSMSYKDTMMASMSYKDAIAAGWTMTDDGFWIPPQENKEDKVNRWILPVNEQNGEQFINLPDELLEQVNWSEGDTLEWIPSKGDAFILQKVSQ